MKMKTLELVCRRAGNSGRNNYVRCVIHPVRQRFDRTGGNPLNAAQIVSDGGNATPYGGVSLVPTTVTTVSTLTFLATDYQMTAGDCGAGSPRFAIGLSSGKNIFVYVGPAPNYTACAPGWQSTGNLLVGSVDTSQIGGTFYDTWANALVLAGGSTVDYIDLVVDSGSAARFARCRQPLSTTCR